MVGESYYILNIRHFYGMGFRKSRMPDINVQVAGRYD